MNDLALMQSRRGNCAAPIKSRTDPVEYAWRACNPGVPFPVVLRWDRGGMSGRG